MARLLLLGAVIIWGWTFVATKVCLAYLSAIELLGLRLLVAIPVLLAVIRIRGIPLRLTGHRRSLLLGSVIFGAHFWIQITGLRYTSATNTGWIIAVSPLVIALLAKVLLRERLTGRMALGIAIATSGILLLVSRGDLGSLDWIRSAGDWLILASAHTWALFTIVVRDVSRSQNPMVVTLAVLVPPGLVVLGIMAFTSDWTRFAKLPLEPVLALLFLGVLGTAFAQWCWQEGVARIGAARAGVFLYLEPLATTALAVPYLGESIGPATLAGGSMVLLGVWWAGRRGEGTDRAEGNQTARSGRRRSVSER